MRTIVAAKTDVGQKRQNNEDALLVDEQLGLFVVCDGMGGHAAGDVASRTAVETIHERVRARLPSVNAVEPDRRAAAMTEVMREAVERANARVHELGAADVARHGAGTTCTALLARQGTAVLAHVGDSRMYLERAGQVHQISNDHTFVAEAMRRGMSHEQAHAHFSLNLLSRAIGPQEHVDIDTLSFDLLPGDRLLLCSDGLHGYFPEPAELAPLLETVAVAPDRLVALANERGGEDNITVIALEVATDLPTAVEDSIRLSRVSQDLRALRGIEILRELSYSELLEVAGALRSEEHEAGAVVLREAESSEALYIIASGRVAVERGGKRLTELGLGSHFGEMALLTNRPRSATVRTLEPCRLLVLGREPLYPLFQNNPVIAVKFLWNLAVRQSLRLDETTEWLSGRVDAVPDTTIDSWRDDLRASPFSQRPASPSSRRR